MAERSGRETNETLRKQLRGHRSYLLYYATYSRHGVTSVKAVTKAKDVH